MLATDSRLVLLATTARIRGSGWIPWLLFAAWVALAAAQEPRLLRAFGVHLPLDAAWVGGLLLWGGAVLRGDAACRMSWAVNLLLLGVVAALQACVGLLVDDVSAGLVSAALFLLAWAPLALALQPHRMARSRRSLRAIVVAAAIVVGSAQSVALRLPGLELGNLLAAASSLAAASLWASIDISNYKS